MFSYDMIIYLHSRSKEFNILLDLISKFSKTSGHKMNNKKSTVFPYTSNGQFETDFLTVSFKITSKTWNT